MEVVRPEADRKEIFRVLVETQDRRVSVDESRRRVAGQFKISVDSLRQIEREGLEKNWPPLS